MNGEILISLLTKETDKFLFQRGFALVAVGTGLDWFIFCYYSVFGCLGYDIEIAHAFSSLKVRSLSR